MPLRAPHPVGESQDRLRRFRNLMPRRVRRLLLVASRHDQFVLEEDGHLGNLNLAEFPDRELRSAPWMRRASTGRRAIELLRRGRPRFDCVVATTHVRDMNAVEFAREVAAAGLDVPVLLLAFDDRELDDIRAGGDLASVDRLYAWQGDSRLLLAAVRSLEDRWNVAADTTRVGVSSILLIEDSVRSYSSFLPLFYEELLAQSARVIREGTNLTNRIMRMRARPKVLHCKSYEEAVACFDAWRGTLLGVVSDVDFPREGRLHAQSGIDFARTVRESAPDMPVLLQTRDPAYAEHARRSAIDAVLKDSPVLLEELSRFIRENFGFGDFVFRSPEGAEIARATDLRDFEAALRVVPDASIEHHAARNHFSTWLRARTEFSLAEEFRGRTLSDFATTAEVRAYLVGSIRAFRRERQRGVVAEFDGNAFEHDVTFARVGGGSLGGKARGLAFVRRLLHEARIEGRFENVRIACPSAVILATDVFDAFLDGAGLRDFALRERDDAEIERRFLAAPLPADAEERLARFLATADYPLAVRSSSLLEDSQHLPFAGIYRTFMVANAGSDASARLHDLSRAVRRVYASTFMTRAKHYIAPTPYLLEQEKMAVIVQRLVGSRHGDRFYPDFSGVARSCNFYPVAPMTAADGTVSVAVGLGEMVVEGGPAVRFCPRHPERSFGATTRDVLRGSQTEFYALNLAAARSGTDPVDPSGLSRCSIETAARDGTLGRLASTYSAENDALYDGLGRPGTPVVTFAPILKQRLFPLPEIAGLLLDVGRRGLNMPVEIEFAVNLGAWPREPAEFAVLQLRPCLSSRDDEHVEVGERPRADLVCTSSMVLGNGRIEDVRDLVVVDRDRLDRSCSTQAAAEVARMNARLAADGVPYVLIGPGRWGASDPWLGIPVTWEQIAGARVIVEASFRDLDVVPSQGSHFFQNLTAARTGYFAASGNEGYVDWAWLAAQTAVEEGGFARRIRLDTAMTVLMDGRTGRGVVRKPKYDS